ncbi:MAG: DUF2065 domain-containing protein [Oceanicaulis sp.]
MDLTGAIALVIGVYALAAAAAVGGRPGKLEAMMKDFSDRPGLAFSIGVLVYFLSAAGLIAHHGLGDWRAVVITVVLALSAIEGLSLMVIPRPFLGVASSLLSPGRARIWAGFAGLLGVALIVLAFL